MGLVRIEPGGGEVEDIDRPHLGGCSRQQRGEPRLPGTAGGRRRSPPPVSGGAGQSGRREDVARRLGGSRVPPYGRPLRAPCPSAAPPFRSRPFAAPC